VRFRHSNNKGENVPAKVARRSTPLHFHPLEEATAPVVNVLHNGGGNIRLVVTSGCQVAHLVLIDEIFKDAIAPVVVAGRAAAAQDIGLAQIVNEVQLGWFGRRRRWQWRRLVKVWGRCIGVLVDGGSLVRVQ
jgi:hypothetical protein